jgi:hypothetical protein
MKTRIFNSIVNMGAAILLMEAVKYVHNATPADNVVISMGGIIIFGLLDLGDKIKGEGL